MPQSITTGSHLHGRSPVDPAAERYHVYHLHDAAGALLYVGRSCQPLTRLRAHHKSADWAAQVTEIEGHGPYTWAEAVRRERADILRMRPPHNVDGVTKNTGRKVDVVSDPARTRHEQIIDGLTSMGAHAAADIVRSMR